MKQPHAPETTLQASQERFRILVDCVQDYAIFMLDPEGYILTWNAGASRIKGYEEAEIVGEHFSKFYSEVDLKAGKPESELRRARQEGRVTDEGWRIRKDGTRFWGLVVITTMRDDHGEIVGFAKVTRDLTERKAIEEKLRASEEQFRMLVQGVEDYAIYLLDPNGTIVTWNTGAEKLKGYSAHDIIGKNFACFYTSAEVGAGRPQQNLEHARRTGHIRDEGLRVRKDGTTFMADVVLTALHDHKGNLRGFAKVTRDITEQVRSRALEAEKVAAETANKAKDDFLAALSHELRTPLMPALTAATLLAHNAERFPADLLEDVQTIRRNVQLEARLIDDLLDLTRLTRGKLELRFERADAHVLINDALKVAASDIAEKKLKVSSDLGAKKYCIWADSVRIEQVFWNLINNSVKFTPPGGKISVRTRNLPDGRFEFEITDNGIGIEPSLLRALFQPFEQGDRKITRQFGGLGLGLAISKQLVDLHEGKIEVESGGRSFGATFRVTLAVATAEQMDPTVATRSSRSPVKALRILLVEDHDDTRRTLSRLLTHFGHKVSVAETAERARALIDGENFDVLLSDIGLPDGSGYELMTEAKRKQRLKGVALTGFGSEGDVRRGREAGFDFHLTKPVDFHELRSVLDQIGK
jgi:PAS domain S-box-containing protein